MADQRLNRSGGRRRSRNTLEKTEGRFGPYVPMRGAFGQAMAIMNGVYRPVSPTEAQLGPRGKSYALTYHGYNKMRDWN